jgi:hypothetical protein
MLKYIVAALLLAVSLATGNAQAVAQGQPHEAGAAKKVKKAPCYRNPRINKCRFTPEARGERRY